MAGGITREHTGRSSTPSSAGARTRGPNHAVQCNRLRRPGSLCCMTVNGADTKAHTQTGAQADKQAVVQIMYWHLSGVVACRLASVCTSLHSQQTARLHCTGCTALRRGCTVLWVAVLCCAVLTNLVLDPHCHCSLAERPPHLEVCPLKRGQCAGQQVVRQLQAVRGGHC